MPGWHTPTLACVQIGGQSIQPLDSSSTFGVWVGEFSGSLSATRQMLVDVPPPRLLPVSQERAINTIQDGFEGQ